LGTILYFTVTWQGRVLTDLEPRADGVPLENDAVVDGLKSVASAALCVRTWPDRRERADNVTRDKRGGNETV